jgi:hypothetical protein
MLKIRFPSNYNQRAGVNRLLIKYGNGLTLTDKLSFSVLKISYLGLWLITYLIPREKKRKNKFYKIEFRDFYSFINFLAIMCFAPILSSLLYLGSSFSKIILKLYESSNSTIGL